MSKIMLNGVQIMGGVNGIFKFTPETTVIKTTIAINSTPQNLTITEDGYYTLRAANNTGEGTIKVALCDTTGDELISSTIFNGNTYDEIVLLVMYLTKGVYKYRAKGQICQLIKYNERLSIKKEKTNGKNS